MKSKSRRGYQPEVYENTGQGRAPAPGLGSGQAVHISADKLKDKLTEKIDGIFGGSKVTATGSKTKDNTGLSSLLSFSYSDYLRLFLMIGLYTNEEAVLLRTADVIQTNMAKKTGESDYQLSKSSVYVELNATVQVKPTLLALPLFADVEGNPSTDTNWYTISYNDIKGY